ncbi:MAG: TonB-dependent receptor [Rhizomicrobium sp.]|nr:TonB-dependent receptor [Rhizomicrobium sp.]
MKTYALWLSASALALNWCASSYAQTTAPKSDKDEAMLETVVVTAQRRSENLMKTAISATVLTSEDITNKGVAKIDDLQFISPAVVIDNFGQGIDFNIRGIGKGEHNAQTLTGVITYRDGVATFPGYFVEEPYYDIAGVELLRGPQGTFVGQNATGGAVFVTTNGPQIGGGYDGYVQAQYGNYNDAQLQGAINIPINDKLAIRFSGFGETRSSFFSIIDRDPADNCPGQKYSGCKPGYNPGDQRWAAGRLSVLWKPTDRLTVSLKFDADYLDNGGYIASPFTERFKTLDPTWLYPGTPAPIVAAGTPNPHYSDLFHVSANYKSGAMDRFTRTVLKADYEFPDGIVLRSVSGYQNGKTDYYTDLDGTDYGAPTTLQAVAGAAVSPQNPRYWDFWDQVTEHIWSEELNLISPADWRVNWVFGLYAQADQYYYPQGKFSVGITPNPAIVGAQPTPPSTALGTESILWGRNPQSTLAAFGQIGYKLLPNLEVQLGGRYSVSRTVNDASWNQYGLAYSVTSHDAGGHLAEDNFSYKGSLNWSINDNNFVYGFIATGFKAGGLNPPIYNLSPPTPFHGETVLNYEAGWKSTLFDGHVRTVLDGYYNDYKGFIVTIGWPAYTAPTFTTEVNAPKPTITYGFEGEIDAVFGDLSFGGGIGVMHDSLGGFWAVDGRVGSNGLPCSPTTGPATTPGCVNLDGHRMTYAPDFTFNLSAQYIFHLNDGDKLTPRANFGHQSPQWATLFENSSLGDRLAARNLLGAQLEWTHGNYVVTLYSTNLTDQHYVGALNSGLDYAGPPRQFGIRLLNVF